MSCYRKGNIYYYSFVANGRRVQLSTRQSSRRVAQMMESDHRRRIGQASQSGDIAVGRCLTVGEEQRLLCALDEQMHPHLTLLVRLMLFTSIRSGEVLKLNWRDIDLDGMTLQVSRGSTASPVGVRSILLPTTLLAAIAEYRTSFQKRFHEPETDHCVFPTHSNPKIPIRTVRREWALLAQRTGVRCRLHDLPRAFLAQLVASGHTCATQILARSGHAAIKRDSE